MAVNLDKALSWMNANESEEVMLRRLQGNILKGHGRHHTVNVFFRIDAGRRAEMRAALRSIARDHMISALDQLDEARQFHAGGPPGGAFVATMLSATGYAALDVAAGRVPADPSFRKGMKAAQLGDPPVESWDAAFRGQVDGMILIGGRSPEEVAPKRVAIVALLRGAGGSILAEQKGKAIFDERGEGIEHFGYVDGRSQPLPLLEDLAREGHEGGLDEWNPHAPLGVALVPDPGTDDGVSFGSYFIFRKLDQDVLGFKRREQKLATALGLTGGARELAGAYAVGRFEDGTPVTLSGTARGGTPPNNFNYDQDRAGARCPFHAHIRKTNPRGTGGFEEPGDERKHLMLRRGIPYEDVPRKVEPKDLPDVESEGDFEAQVAPKLPSRDVGLLFMAYNRDLADQFEFTQVNWANNPDFPRNGLPEMLDALIGQPAGSGLKQSWPRRYGDHAAGTIQFSFADFVTMRGGEYFFAPSLTFLRHL
ncbi:Dyp-type peroxidase [Pararoseomonas indoligenes]|uniref:Dyp-type peroxidase n=1 Tax=Roseomonas indoligenes TaxID=2820811 RepID=A0A940MXY9_9PROT|nr:Dyp-type peroxidase [Pararoseomonas indoligenes]MBP0492511.1 Dyp-type peroxidase [Pararoseomonas indoligenes]